MREVGVLEAKTQLSALLESVEAGAGPVLITRHGRPVAKLSAATAQPQPSGRRLTGPEIAEGFRELRERLARDYPQTNDLTWDELKAMARE